MWLAALLQALAGQVQSGDGGIGLRRFEFEETHMASPFNIVLYSTDETTARRASRKAYDRIAQLNAILSDYDPESELSRLARSAGGAGRSSQHRPFRGLEALQGDLASDRVARLT